tara:strand:+ start:552 stop:791 length:240 start_codon:yes stop_codon:yes gene_type:complete
MPTYTFKSNKTGKEWDDVIKIAELDAYYIEHDCEQVIGGPTIIMGVGEGRLKTTDHFNDRMKEIKKKAGPHSTIGNIIR